MQDLWFQDAGRCFECQRTLPPDEPVFRVQARQWLALVWVCNDCVLVIHDARKACKASNIIRPNIDLIDINIPPANTCPVCGRELFVLEEVSISRATDTNGQPMNSDGTPHDYARFARYCSERCRLKLVAAARREARHQKAADKCAHCGKPLDDSRRSDARYCSPLCRMHELRKRRRAEPGHYKTKEEIRQERLNRYEQRRIQRMAQIEISKEAKQ